MKAKGALVMNYEQLIGEAPYHENWGLNLGQEIDDEGDPPRVWAPGHQAPGCAFTRSIGDAMAKKIGVTATPEVVEKTLSPFVRKQLSTHRASAVGLSLLHVASPSIHALVMSLNRTRRRISL